MSRSLKKGPWVDPKLQKKIEKARAGENIKIKTWCRSSTVTPGMVGLTIEVHNGIKHIPVHVVEEMINHKLGEFAPTRKFVKHGGRMQRDIERTETQKSATPASASAAPAVKK